MSTHPRPFDFPDPKSELEELRYFLQQMRDSAETIRLVGRESAHTIESLSEALAQQLEARIAEIEDKWKHAD